MPVVHGAKKEIQTEVREISEEEFLKNVNVSEYEKKYSEKGFWSKIKKNVSSVGIVLIRKALQLFYVAQSPNCPMKVKAGIYGALGYFIAPLDFIMDIIPFVGYTDDTMAIALALTFAQMYVDDEVNRKVDEKLKSIFGENFEERKS